MTENKLMELRKEIDACRDEEKKRELREKLFQVFLDEVMKDGRQGN